MDKSYVSKQAGYLETKLGLSSGRFDQRHVFHLLNSFAPDNENVEYHDILQQHVEDGESKLVPGFKISVPIKNASIANLLMNLVKGQKNLFPFDTSISFNRSKEGVLHFDLCSQGDYTKSLRRPTTAVAVNMEMYLKYATFRMVAQYISINRVYNFSDDQLRASVIPESRLSTMSTAEKLKATQDTILQKHPQIETLLNERLTSSDLTHCGTLFREAREELKLALSPKVDATPKLSPDLELSPDLDKHRDIVQELRLVRNV